jgi:NADH-quinone oxidoreductase subunit N
MPVALSNVDSVRWFSPELVLSAGAILILVVDLVAKRSSRKLSGTLAMIALVATAATLLATSDGQARGLFGGLIARDPFADFWKYLFLAVTALVGWASLKSKETIDYADGDRDAAEFYALNLSVCLGLFLMAAATDLLMAYLSIEFVSILSFVLAGYKRRDRRSSEAALKYTIYGGVASGVMLYGLSLLYGMAGSLSVFAIKDAVGDSSATLIVAVVLAMAGFGYKIASVPFHMWCPDVYEGAPTPITAFLSVGPKAAGFAMLMRFFLGAVPFEVKETATQTFGSEPWPVLLGAIAVLTMTLGNLVAIVQQNVKRMLAYSSIAHAGYVLLGLVVMAASGRPDDAAQRASGAHAMMFYLVAYLFMNIGAFGVVIALLEKGFGETVDDLKGLGYRAPFVGAVMAIFLFSLTGLPPTAGFAGKFLLFAALLENGSTMLVTLAVIGVLNSAISLYYYARILKAMYFDRPMVAGPISIDRQHGVLLGMMAFPVIVLGILWSPLQAWAERAFQMWGIG